MGFAKASGLVGLFLGAAISSWASPGFGQAPPPPPAQPPAGQQPAPPPPAAQPYPGQPQQQPYPAQPPPQQPYPAQPAPSYPPPEQAPPPGGYPPPTYYPAPPPPYAAPAPVAAPRYPDDASTQASPFFDALIFGTFADERFSDPLMFGGQVGGYLAGRVRLAARLLLTTDPENNASPDYYQYIDYGYNEELPSLLYGASIGLVVAQRTKFVFAPGLTVNRTELADYGTIFGATFPFEWVMRGGVRFGFEAAIGRGFGGEINYECVNPTSTTCTQGDEITQDRDSGIFLMIGIAIGYGIGYPEPTMPAEQ